MDFKYTRISLRRPLTDYTKVQQLLTSVMRNRSLFINQRRLREKEYLDVGCHLNMHDNFINLDRKWHPGIDICWDIAKGVPLPDGAVRGIFTEHCLEHLPFDVVDRVLGEFRRVLKPGGRVRIVIPDGELYLTRYTDIIRNQSHVQLPYSEGDAYHGLYSPIMSVNRIFRAHGHLYIHDFDVFRQLLEKNGFIEIKKERYKSGRDPFLLIDTESRAVESLYVEASVPEVESLFKSVVSG